MPEPLPLADASRRLRKAPGRPRTVHPDGAEAPASKGAPASQASVLRAAQLPMRGFERPVAEMWPRLLGIEEAARYLAVSPWTIREYLAVGILTRVSLPSATRGTTRRVLLDCADLDRLVESSKGAAEAVAEPPG